MFYVYILFSEITGKYYCGQTENILQRLAQHNLGEVFSTKNGKPWTLIGFLIFQTRSEAMMKERQVKKRGIGRWIEQFGSTLKKDF